jgi:integrase
MAAIGALANSRSYALERRREISQFYQRGYLRLATRKSGAPCWEFLWRENNELGLHVRRTAAIGSIQEYPTRQSASMAANGLRMQVNVGRRSFGVHQISIRDLIDHYIYTELAADASWHAHSTRTIYSDFSRRWIRPHWGHVALFEVRTLAVEHWLRRRRRADGSLLADATKAKIRNLFSVLFNHAIRCEWLDQGKNPITLVRQSAKHKNAPQVLEIDAIQSLMAQLQSGYRLMVLLAVTTGLRRSELFGLRCGDVDFSDLKISVQRSLYQGVVGSCKTETSCKPIPIDERVAADLWLWQEASKYRGPEHWVFASSWNKGYRPLWPGTVLQKVVQPAARKARISGRIGWHTFRHTYSTLLVANGENVKVVQELMRHASTRFTLEI